jgi:hypothetical protein
MLRLFKKLKIAIFDRFLVEGKTAFFRTLLFFMKRFGESCLKDCHESSSFWNKFEFKISIYSKVAHYKSKISKLYINEETLKAVQKQLISEKMEGEGKRDTSRHQYGDRCIFESPFCFNSRSIHLNKDLNFVLISSDYIDLLKFNYFDPFKSKNEADDGNHLSDNELQDFNHLSDKFSSYREWDYSVSKDQSEIQSNIDNKLESFEERTMKIDQYRTNAEINKNVSFSATKNKKPLDFITNEFCTNENQELFNNEALNFPNLQCLKAQSEIFCRQGRDFPHVQFDKNNQAGNHCSTDNHNSEFFGLLTQDLALDDRTGRDVHIPINEDIVTRAKASKSECKPFVDKISGIGFKEKQSKHPHLQSELLLVRSNHICYLRHLNLARLNEIFIIKELFFEKRNRLIDKHLGMLITAFLSQIQKPLLIKNGRKINRFGRKETNGDFKAIIQGGEEIHRFYTSLDEFRPSRSQDTAREGFSKLSLSNDQIIKNSKFPNNLDIKNQSLQTMPKSNNNQRKMDQLEVKEANFSKKTSVAIESKNDKPKRNVLQNTFKYPSETSKLKKSKK